MKKTVFILKDFRISKITAYAFFRGIIKRIRFLLLVSISAIGTYRIAQLFMYCSVFLYTSGIKRIEFITFRNN